eukprot:12673638-Ditylum_brightwellii.AAC.2
MRAAGVDIKCCPLEPERWLQRASIPSSTQLQRWIVCTHLWWGGACDKTAVFAVIIVVALFRFCLFMPEKAEVHFLPCIPYLTKRMDCQVAARAKIIRGNRIALFLAQKATATYLSTLILVVIIIVLCR